MNTNIPIKIIGAQGYLITKNYEILKFSLDQLTKGAQVATELVVAIPHQYTIGLTDYFINENSVWIVSDRTKKFIFALDLNSTRVDTLLQDQGYIWNSYPFLGAQISKCDAHTFCLPFVKISADTVVPLFSTFELRKNKLIHKKGHGVFNAGIVKDWSPFSMIPIYSNFYNGGYWITTSTGQKILHYSLQNGSLQQDQSVCFPSSSVEGFAKNLSFNLQKDKTYSNHMDITASYNMRVLCDQNHVIKVVKKKQAFLNHQTQIKRVLNDSPWFMDCLELKTNKVQRFEFKEKTHFYTYAIVWKGTLFVAKQPSDSGTINFNIIHL